MMRLSSPALLLTLALAAPVLADTPRSTPSTIDAYAMVQTETVTATVKAIDLKTRHATLRLPDGKKQTFAVDPQVKNLDKVKRGDQVVVQYKGAIEVELTTPDPTQPLPPPTEAMVVDHRPAEDGKPEGVVARTMTLTGTVESYDPERRVAVIKGSDGETLRVNIQHPERWTQVKAGDIVTARFSEALAIAVQPPPPRIPKHEPPLAGPAR
jgi:Cu/Ag efflux protein CusF